MIQETSAEKENREMTLVKSTVIIMVIEHGSGLLSLLQESQSTH